MMPQWMKETLAFLAILAMAVILFWLIMGQC